MSSSTINGTNVIVPTIGPNTCDVTVKVVDQAGMFIDGAIVSAKLIHRPEFAQQAIVANVTTSQVTNSNGEATLVLIRQAAFTDTEFGEYKIYVKYGRETYAFRYFVPNLESVVAYLPLS